MYREHRGDAHVVAWAAQGLNGCEACILNDLRQVTRSRLLCAHTGLDN